MADDDDSENGNDREPSGGDGFARDGKALDDQLVLVQYETLREEVHVRIGQHYRNLLAGLSVVGVVTGYGLLARRVVVVTAVPFLIGFLAVQTVRHLNAILFLARHLNEIEQRYDDVPLFGWERRFGMTGSGRTVVRWGIDWSSLPARIVTATGVIVYLVFVVAAIQVWPAGGLPLFGLSVGRCVLLTTYFLYSAAVALVGISFRLHREELSPD